MKHRSKGRRQAPISRPTGGPVFVSPEDQKRMSLDTRWNPANHDDLVDAQWVLMATLAGSTWDLLLESGVAHDRRDVHRFADGNGCLGRRRISVMNMHATEDTCGQDGILMAGLQSCMLTNHVDEIIHSASGVTSIECQLTVDTHHEICLLKISLDYAAGSVSGPTSP